MKTSKSSMLPVLAALLLSTIISQLSTARAQGTAFTYQGRLNSSGNPASGSYDLTFSLWTNSTGPAQVGSTLTNTATAVTNGLFTVTLDFGANFPGADRWLEIGVRTNGGGAFTNLSPRQKITPTPYAITAANVVNSGGGLTNLNAGSLVTGTVSDLRLSTNIARLNASQTFTGVNHFTNQVAIGSLSPIYPLDISANGIGMVHEDGSRVLGTFLDAGGGWFGTMSSHPLHFFVNDDLEPSMTIDTNRFVGIGTAFPVTPFNVVANGYGIEHDFGDVSLSTYIDPNAAWFGTVSGHPLYFYVVNGVDPSLAIRTDGNVGIGTNNPTERLHVRGNILATGTVTGSSDRNAKENFAPVNPAEVLEKVAALPISRWDYKADAGVAHIGPMAQDFHAAFGVGMDDTHISMVDADGVAFAAIQGLNQKLTEKEARIRELEERLIRLEKLMTGTSRK